MKRSTLRQRVQAYLRDHHVMTLATCGDEGPWAAAVFYVHEGRALYFPSALGSGAAAPAAIVKALAKVRWYRMAPDRAYFIDNSVAFGHRDAVDLE